MCGCEGVSSVRVRVVLGQDNVLNSSKSSGAKSVARHVLETLHCLAQGKL